MFGGRPGCWLIENTLSASSVICVCVCPCAMFTYLSRVYVYVSLRYVLSCSGFSDARALAQKFGPYPSGHLSHVHGRDEAAHLRADC